MLTCQVITIGDELGLVLDRDAAAKLNVKDGDFLCLTAAPEGGLLINRYHPDFTRQVTLAEQLMREDREVLHALATSALPTAPTDRE